MHLGNTEYRLPNAGRVSQYAQSYGPVFVFFSTEFWPEHSISPCLMQFPGYVARLFKV